MLPVENPTLQPPVLHDCVQRQGQGFTILSLNKATSGSSEVVLGHLIALCTGMYSSQLIQEEDIDTE